MYDFQRELQQLNVGEFQSSQVVPWDYNQYQSVDARVCFSCFFPIFSCFGCGGCFGCFRCGGCGGRCGGCGGCGRCGGHR